MTFLELKNKIETILEQNPQLGNCPVVAELSECEGIIDKTDVYLNPNYDKSGKPIFQIYVDGWTNRKMEKAWENFLK